VRRALYDFFFSVTCYGRAGIEGKLLGREGGSGVGGLSRFVPVGDQWEEQGHWKLVSEEALRC